MRIAISSAILLVVISLVPDALARPRPHSSAEYNVVNVEGLDPPDRLIPVTVFETTASLLTPVTVTQTPVAPATVTLAPVTITVTVPVKDTVTQTQTVTVTESHFPFSCTATSSPTPTLRPHTPSIPILPPAMPTGSNCTKRTSSSTALRTALMASYRPWNHTAPTTHRPTATGTAALLCHTSLPTLQRDERADPFR